jgi:hypothetical protein
MMLYIPAPLPEFADADLRSNRSARRRRGACVVHSPRCSTSGAHTGCGCGFPHVLAETPIEYFEGMFGDEDREADVRSTRRLMELVRSCVDRGETVELYAAWAGDEGRAPKGKVRWGPADLDPERTVFTEGFLYVVHASTGRPASR